VRLRPYRRSRGGGTGTGRLAKLGLALVAVLAFAGIGAAGYAVAHSSASSDTDANRAREEAYRASFDIAERAGFIETRSRGFRDGQKQGYQAGLLAGRHAADQAISQIRAQPKPTKAQTIVPPETIWAVGDGADGGPGAASVARMIASNSVDHFIYLGDVYPEGTAAQFVHAYDPAFGVFSSITEPTPGNHDTPALKTGYEFYWAKVMGHPIQHYYSWTAGGWQLLSLDSEDDHSAGSAQVSWAKQKIASSPSYGTCRIAYWHRPLMNDGTVHGDNPDVAPLWDALAGNASIVLNGHEHDIQRFAPRDGITEFVSGAGGHEHYPVHGGSGLAFSNDSDFGALRLVLKPGLARYSFVSAAGKVLDSGSIPCKRG
jgi:Calcineurin-like phosphoesterase